MGKVFAATRHEVDGTVVLAGAFRSDYFKAHAGACALAEFEIRQRDAGKVDGPWPSFGVGAFEVIEVDAFGAPALVRPTAWQVTVPALLNGSAEAVAA